MEEITTFPIVNVPMNMLTYYCLATLIIFVYVYFYEACLLFF